MPTVFIPPMLRPIANGAETIDVEVGTLRHVIEELESRFPGFRDRVREDGEFRPDMSVAIDGNIASHGMSQKVPAGAEVHFLPALGGG